MGALPKQRVSKARQGRRRSHLHLRPIQLVACTHCHKMKRPHHVCPACGTYEGLEVIKLEAKKKK